MRPGSRTLGALIDEQAAARPDADAIVFRGERLTFAALRDRSDAIARAFLAVGVRKDDRIAILLPNRPEWLIAAFAAAKVGAVSVAISTFSTAREIAWTLEHAQPTVVVTMEAFRGRGYLRAIHAVCPELGRAEPGMLQSERLPELRAVVSIDERRHDGVYAWTDLLERATEVRATALAAAQAAVSAVDVCYILYTSGSTATPKGVMLAHGGVIDNGFDIGERQHLTAADRVWLAVPLFWSFGSANALPAILTHGGTLVMQESFEPGEALALLDGERTRAAFDADGFFVTGDLGTVGGDGRIRFRGRLKEMIKTGGINVAPLEVEAVLLAHPAVKQAYVVGLSDRGKGEVAAAAVELHEGATATAEALTVFCRERLASYKVPARIIFRKAGEFPLTATGKVQKPRLREELERLCAP